MGKLFYKAMVEDVQQTQCTEAELEGLLAIYTNTVKRMATTSARKAWFELEDFASARKLGVTHFNLMIERRKVFGQEQWWGTFQHGFKNLKIIATLERN